MVTPTNIYRSFRPSPTALAMVENVFHAEDIVDYHGSDKRYRGAEEQVCLEHFY